MDQPEFVRCIMHWYAENRRHLPWRETHDPYKIWLSEIILQQTRVAQGLPYYKRFLQAFPDIVSLAKAREQSVLRLWQGLGYYSRARNLHRCARIVAMEWKGHFPKTYPDLLSLPGIGPYTAAAIGSIAFNIPAAVVDGNVFRVLARIFGIDDDISTPAGKIRFTKKANELIPERHPGDFNQAMMEFGAIHCTPQKPKCGECPFIRNCYAFNHGMIDWLPVKGKKVKSRTRHFHYFVFFAGKKIALRKRESKDIWTGLYDFFLAETLAPSSLKKVVDQNALLSRLQPSAALSLKTKHVLTHQVLQLKFYPVVVRNDQMKWIQKAGMRFYSVEQAEKLPKPVPIKQFLDDYPF